MIERTDRTSSGDDDVFDARVNDSARLKSGGPPMIVAGVDNRIWVTCLWFGLGNVVQTAVFHRDMLNLFRWHGA